MRAAVTAGAIFLAVVVAVGCGGKAEDKGQGVTPPDGKAPPGVNQVGKRPRTPLEVALVDATMADLDKRVDDEKIWSVVQVDFWSLASEPPKGVTNFSARPSGPGKGEESKPDPKAKVTSWGMARADYMMGRYGTSGLTMIGVNVDPPEKRAEVLKHLQDVNAGMVVNFFWADQSPEAKARLAERYKFTGTVPHQVLFDRQGKRAWSTGEPFPDRVLDNQTFKTGSLDEYTFYEVDKR